MHYLINSQDDREKLTILMQALQKIEGHDVFILPAIPNVIKVTGEALTIQQMKELTTNGEKLLLAEVLIPFDKFMAGYGEHNGLDVLNDLISKKVTGEEHALTDFHYQVRGADEQGNMILYVEGNIQEYLRELEEAEEQA
jgi:hypothetical protein